MINLSPADLDAFLSVAETGSFRQSAEQLHVSQPTISTRIRHLEDVLMVKLFHRTTRRVVITDAGERLRSRVEHMVLETRALLTEFREEALLQRGRLAVGASPSVASGFLPAVIREFRQRWPDVEISVMDDFYGQALERIRNGQVDLAVAPLVPGEDAYVCDPLLDDVFKLAVPDNHRLASEGTVTLADFANEPQIAMPPESAAWATLRAAFVKADQELAPAYMTRYSLTLISMVREGLGVGLVSGLFSRNMDMRGVTLLEVTDADLTRNIGIVYARDRAPNPAADAFRSLLFKHAESFKALSA